jgi:glycosyltransferase involved in cell wall biosynthesis
MRGGQRQVFYLARALARTPGFDPLVAIPERSPLVPLLDAEGIPYETLPSHSDLNPLNIFRLFRIISAHKPQIVHTNDAKGASLAALTRLTKGGFKLVHSRRVSYRLRHGWSKRKYEAGDALVAVSHEIQDVLIQCGIPAEKTSTIHSGIDADMYSTVKNDHAVLTIGAVGALSTQKGFEVLIEALGELRKNESMPDWQCLIAGDGPLFQELKVKADEQGLAESILFLGYRDSREVLPEIDILTVPSVDGEGSNAVIKEGWASATPVITSDLPSNLELVVHEQNGLVFRNRDARELADAIARIVNDKELAKTLVHNGSVSVGQFTDKTMAEKYMRIYRDLSARPPFLRRHGRGP